MRRIFMRLKMDNDVHIEACLSHHTHTHTLKHTHTHTHSHIYEHRFYSGNNNTGCFTNVGKVTVKHKL
jgi:hypothetical protein